MNKKRRARGPGVLVVDGEALVRRVLREGLRREGFAVWSAGDCTGALKVYQRHREAIDLVVMEIRLPGPDGVRTLAALRDLNPGVRCCFMMTHEGAFTGEELLGRGADAVLTKPFGPRVAAQVLRRLLARPPAMPRKSEKYLSIPC